MVKVDLKDAYLTVPIHLQDRKFLRFSWEQEVFQFRSLPFGLASAPRTFTKLLRPLLALLRSQGLRMVVFLDDILLMASSKELIGQHLTLLVSWLEELGFIINKDKSVMEPGHQIEFLGLTVNSNTMSLSVPQDKIAKVQKECRHMLDRGAASARELSHLIGLLSSLIRAVLPAPLHYRALQRLKHQALTSLGSWDLQVSLNSSSQRDLVFWVSQLKEHNGRSLEFPVATMIISSDASKSGWGAYSSISSVVGHWSPAERDLHINALELKAAFLALKSLASHQRDCHILLLLDNITAISFINHKGGTRSHTLQTWHWKYGPGACRGASLYIQSNSVAFQMRLSISSPQPGGGAQKSRTTQPGPNGVAGVPRGRLIPFYLLERFYFKPTPSNNMGLLLVSL